MNANNVTFRSNYGYEYNPYQQQNVATYQEQPVVEDKQKSNAAKYMIGATALAGVVALGILGHKGYLGKDIQKFMKNIGGEASKVTKKEPPKPTKALEFKAAEGSTDKVCHISEELKQAIKTSEGDISALEKLDTEGFGTFSVLRKYETGKPQFVTDGWHLYEFDRESGNLCKRLEKSSILEHDGTEWISRSYISNIEKLDPTNPSKVLSKISLDSENNVVSYVKNVEWDADLRPIVEHHYENDMETLKSIFHNKYESDFGYMLNHTLEYAPDGKTLLSKRIYDGDKVSTKHDYFRGTKKICHSIYYNNEKCGYIDSERYYRKNGMLNKEIYYDETTHNPCEEYRYHEQPKFRFPWQKKRNLVQYEIHYDPNEWAKAINTIKYDKKGKVIFDDSIIEI